MSAANLERLAQVAERLRALDEHVVFVGGATIGLYLHPQAAATVRVTDDVDCVVDVTGRQSWANLEARLRALGLRNDASDGAPICRWLLGDIRVDIMPPDAATLGFANRHYRRGMQHSAQRQVLGVTVDVLTPIFAVLTKIEAFQGRGADDPFESKDLEDIVAFLDSQVPSVADVRDTSPDLRAVIRAFSDELLNSPAGIDLIEAHMPLGPRYDDRVDQVVAHLKALRTLG